MSKPYTSRTFNEGSSSSRKLTKVTFEILLRQHKDMIKIVSFANGINAIEERQMQLPYFFLYSSKVTLLNAGQVLHEENICTKS